jgi:prophage tail gpP-like protein
LTIGDDQVVAGTGIIDDSFVHGDRNGAYIDVSGRDGMSLLQDNVASQKLVISGQKTLPLIADQVVSKYRGHGLDWTVFSDNESNRNILTGRTQPLQARFGAVNTGTVRLKGGSVPITSRAAQKIPVSTDFFSMPFAEARPHLGEYEFEYLDRHARNVGVMMWMDASGSLVFSQPNYAQTTLFKFYRFLPGQNAQRNNILSGGVRRNTANSATTVKVIGHAEGREEMRTQVTHTETLDPRVFQAVLRTTGDAAKAFSASIVQTPSGQKRVIKRETVESVTTFGNYSWPRAKVVRDAHATTTTRAKHVARRAISRANTNLVTVQYEVQGYEQNGFVFAPDTIAYVLDEIGGIEGEFYITGRTLKKDRGSEKTMLKMVPVGAIVL